MQQPTIEILICTIDNRIDAALRVPIAPLPNVRYLVCWQQTNQVALNQQERVLPEREDVRIHSWNGCGLSANRNEALAQASGDFLLIADDDEILRADQLEGLTHLLTKHEQTTDIFLLRMQRSDGSFPKPYPSTPFLYPHCPHGYFPSSWEILIRRTSLPRLPQFDVRFGLGSDRLACGEEEVFIHQAFANGAQIAFIPYTIVNIPGKTTGDLFLQSAAVRRSKGAVLTLLHGTLSAVLRCLKFALLIHRQHPECSWGKCYQYLRDMLEGVRYIRATQ